MLNCFGIRKIHKATTLLEAQSICQKASQLGASECIDFAIVDLVPPNNHGLEFLKWTRHHEESKIKYMPVIFTTNDARQKIIMNGRDCGANEILVKPYTAYNVSNRLVTMINKPRAFVQCNSYSGPTRRRRIAEYEGAERRLTTDADVKIVYEQQNVA
jgi:DNA-binding response OmpR family regulator